MRRVFTTTILAAFMQVLCAQDQASLGQHGPEQLPGFSIPSSPERSPECTLTLDAGYFGETITKPGILIAAHKQISKRNDLHHLRLNIAFYKHTGYNNNLVVLPEYLFRKTGERGFFFEAAAGVGWMYQEPDRLIIEYDNGSFTETNTGWSYLAPTIQMGAGKKVREGAWEGVAFSAGLRWFGQFPFNDFLMHHLALECRISVPVSLITGR
jgi:hypothetical protein